MARVRDVVLVAPALKLHTVTTPQLQGLQTDAVSSAERFVSKNPAMSFMNLREDLCSAALSISWLHVNTFQSLSRKMVLPEILSLMKSVFSVSDSCTFILASDLFPAPGATEMKCELSSRAEDDEISEGFTEASSSHRRREH
ncbi:uncharacterized [Tachysurus ichikawai]